MQTVGSDNQSLFDNHFKLIRALSTDGGTADVWVALDVTTVKNKENLDNLDLLSEDTLKGIGLLVALKIYRPKNALDVEGEDRFRKEYTIVYNCNHTNLIHPNFFSIYNDIPYLVLPYCQKGSSELYTGQFTKSEDLWKYISDVAAGLDYLHRCNPPIIHQDIKPANVLIKEDGNYAITDFGISAEYELKDEVEEEETSGTFAYMAPERFFEDAEATTASDIWALGATLYELITGDVPFGEEGGQNQKPVKVELDFGGKKIDRSIRKLIAACLDYDPAKRPTASELMEAARMKRFPVKQNSLVGLLASSAVVCVLVACLYWFSPDKTVGFLVEDSSEVEAPIRMTDEKLYSLACQVMKYDSPDSIRKGFGQLVQLADNEYIPAMYDVACTYGGMEEGDNKESVKWRVALGIEMGNTSIKKKDAQKFYPKDSAILRTALDLFVKIEKNDSLEYQREKKKSGNYLYYYFVEIEDYESAKAYKAYE